ncbi:MAG: hypothetical protein H6766_07590 [Candidatus Peribacteria bacterium]|nr:MAG: hypothetical protein H6766_07590 [Candidatus Peribacteria bacterium]
MAQVKEQGLWNAIVWRYKKHTMMQFLFRFFVLGLLFQFLVQTFVTFKLGWDGSAWEIIWLWKELLIVGLVVSGAWSVVRGHEWGQTIKKVICTDRFFQ